eukprot:6491656-Amphidinium_carterae.1
MCYHITSTLPSASTIQRSRFVLDTAITLRQQFALQATASSASHAGFVRFWWTDASPLRGRDYIWLQEHSIDRSSLRESLTHAHALISKMMDVDADFGANLTMGIPTEDAFAQMLGPLGGNIAQLVPTLLDEVLVMYLMRTLQLPMLKNQCLPIGAQCDRDQPSCRQVLETIADMSFVEHAQYLQEQIVEYIFTPVNTTGPRKNSWSREISAQPVLSVDS